MNDMFKVGDRVSHKSHKSHKSNKAGEPYTITFIGQRHAFPPMQSPIVSLLSSPQVDNCTTVLCSHLNELEHYAPDMVKDCTLLDE